jgi:anti-anti-sigma regulatory factor
MLKTKLQASGNEITINLQGRLAGSSVQHLAELWNHIRTAELHKGIRVDLTGVSFFDVEGKGLLRQIRESGAELFADDALTQMFLDEVVGTARNRQAYSAG